MPLVLPLRELLVAVQGHFQQGPSGSSLVTLLIHQYVQAMVKQKNVISQVINHILIILVTRMAARRTDPTAEVNGTAHLPHIKHQLLSTAECPVVRCIQWS